MVQEVIRSPSFAVFPVPTIAIWSVLQKERANEPTKQDHDVYYSVYSELHFSFNTAFPKINQGC